MIGQGPTPLYQQVIEHIRQNIRQGNWGVHQQIPSERELCELLGVSRTTVRQALDAVVREGLLERVQGRGTFVARLTVRQPLTGFATFEETLRRLHLEPSVQVLEAGRPVAADAARLLGLPGGQVCLAFRLLGLGSGHPMALYESVVPPAYGTRVRRELDQHRGEGYVLVNELIASLFAFPYLDSEQTYAAAAAGRDEASLLGLRRGAPVLQVTSLFRSPQGDPVEYRRALYRGDQYQFTLNRRIEFAT